MDAVEPYMNEPNYEISQLRNELALKNEELANLQSTTNKRSPFLGKCFCCGKSGHPYYRCPTASLIEKQKIRDNYDELVKQNRINRIKERTSLNANGVATNPQ